MNSERRRAVELGIADPINPTLESTHATYDNAIDFIFSRIRKNITANAFERTKRPLAVILASHNKSSLLKAIHAIDEYNIPRLGGYVHFAQLMGMQDGVAFSLARNGYSGFKYIPYGPIELTMPYLIRRAQENSAMLGGVAADQKNLWNELRRRIHGSPSVADPISFPKAATTATV